MTLLAKNLKYLRESRQLKQNEMLSAIGFKPSTWNNYERAVAEPKILDLISICEFFNVSMDHITRFELSTNVHLNKNEVVSKRGKNVHPNVHPSVHLKEKNTRVYTQFLGPPDALNDDGGTCQHCIDKDKKIEELNKQITALTTALTHAQQRLDEIAPPKKRAG